MDRLAKKAGYEAFAASLVTHPSVYHEAAARFVKGLEQASGPTAIASLDMPRAKSPLRLSLLAL